MRGTAAVSSKLPRITLIFWVMKIAATTLGETGGDLIAQTLNVGYLISFLVLIGIFVITLVCQLSVRTFQPVLYWTVILSTSMAGTTLSDFMDRTLDLGYALGASVLVTALLIVFAVWKLSGHSFNVVDINTFGGELLYWIAILISNTLGTAFGDFLSDDSGLGYGGSAVLVASMIGVLALAMRYTPISNVLLFWVAFVLTRPLGATAGDLFSKPVAKGGLGYGTYSSSIVLLALLVGLIVFSYRQRARVVDTTEVESLDAAANLVVGMAGSRHAELDEAGVLPRPGEHRDNPDKSAAPGTG
ncbi:hypothetical protein V5P93_004136 [Actinokineospora auranticolor]|uniref:Putative membrane-anchored protein n=1 Tax=Actinokineospora auranticolor TaxID=155976 RepID=A0A2S6GDK0_9PSEU|nr:hypothetical protein [Actinokineospora auranticolor]PPK63201.1 putative membrane-anchored protein [Actinokineospora auranticolor]